MVHDLTANGDFSISFLARLNFRLPDRNDEPRPEDELVFTGDSLERESKRFSEDYNADKTICDFIIVKQCSAACQSSYDIYIIFFKNFAIQEFVILVST